MRKVKNSKKIFKLQIKEREQVSKNDKRFNVGKTKRVLQYFQRLFEDTLFVSKNTRFRPKLPPPYPRAQNRESAKLRAKRAYVPTCQIYLRANVPSHARCPVPNFCTCQRALTCFVPTCQRANFLMCQRCHCIYVSTCVRAYVLNSFSCIRPITCYVPKFLTSLHSNVG